MKEIKLSTSVEKSFESSFDQIYFLHHKQLYYLALKFLKDKALAEDVVQETFIRFWNYRDKLDENKSVKGFLFTTAKNLVLNKIRDQKTQILKHLEIAESQPLIAPDSESSYIIGELRQSIDLAIESLSERKKQIFRLKVYDGLSNEEVAGQLGLSINTVKFQFSQSLKMVRDFIKAQSATCVMLAATCFDSQF